MPKFWISFRIADEVVGGRSYEKRYDALEQAVLEEATLYWKETTSLIIFETAKTTWQMADKIRNTISINKDLFIIRSLDSKSAYISGRNDDQDIYDLMDYLEEI